MMRAYLARYVLRSGARGTLTVIAASSCAAVIAAIDALQDDIQRLSVRPA